MRATCRIGGLLLLLAIDSGCSRPQADATVDTGAREVVQSYFDCLLRQDWSGAHALLDAGSSAKCGLKRYSGLATQYRKNLGFDPTEVRIRSCEEHDEQALSHVTWHGQAATGDKFFKDAVALRKSRDGWRILLAANFGQLQTPRK